MPINIHGKSYNTVAERIISAGKDLLEVHTEVLLHDPVVIKATIKTPKGFFSGISAANPSKKMEADSPYEVAETSAVGRALAFAGYETTNGIASAEEVKKAISSPLSTPVSAPVSSDDQVCPIHKCNVPKRLSKTSNKPYWLCNGDPMKGHFLEDKNKFMNDEKY